MKAVTSKNVRDVLWGNLDPDTKLMTDQANYYTIPGRAFPLHATVNHKAGEYVRGEFHTNTVEGFFSQLKRSLDGTYHHVSARHLHRYLTEFDFRYNRRKEKDGERTVAAIRKTAGKRLVYSDATKKH